MNNNIKREKSFLIGYLGQGILPFGQWSCVFSNPELQEKTGLICKSFTVWFPTMLDFIKVPQELQTIIDKDHDEKVEEVKSLILRLQEFYRYFLSLYSREEQIFIIDRRLQNVHGILSIFRLDKIHTKFFDADSGEIQIQHIDADEYHKIMRSFYPELQHNEMMLRNRLVTAERFAEFGEFYTSKLTFEPHLINLAKRLGVFDQGERIKSIY